MYGEYKYLWNISKESYKKRYNPGSTSHSYVALDQHYITEEELELVKERADVV